MPDLEGVTIFWGLVYAYGTIELFSVWRARYLFVAAAGAIGASLLIGTSRVMLGVHWPSDVIAGWSYGLLWVLLTLRIADHLLGADSRHR